MNNFVNKYNEYIKYSKTTNTIKQLLLDPFHTQSPLIINI